MLACGWANLRIAATLRISLPTLRRHYFSELKYREVARDRLNMRRAELLWKEVEGGNVAAMKEFDRFLEKNDRMGFEAEMGEPEGRPAADKSRMGKKAIDEQRAVEADADLMAELDREAAQNARH